MGVFITSTKHRTWKHSLIWFADKVKNAALAVYRLHPTPVCGKEGGRGKDETRRRQSQRGGRGRVRRRRRKLDRSVLSNSVPAEVGLGLHVPQLQPTTTSVEICGETAFSQGILEPRLHLGVLGVRCGSQCKP